MERRGGLWGKLTCSSVASLSYYLTDRFHLSTVHLSWTQINPSSSQYAENLESLSQVTKKITFSSFNFDGEKNKMFIKAWLYMLVSGEMLRTKGREKK